MIIDNREIIKSLLEFPTKDEIIRSGLEVNADYFYVVQLLQRPKDNPSKILNPNQRNNSNRSIYQTNIYSQEDFDEKLPLLIEMAKIFQARVYINLNLKSSYKSFVNLVKNIGCRLETKNYKKLNRIYNEAVGECKGAVFYKNRWIIDVDEPDYDYEFLMNKISSFRGSINGHGYTYAVIPTKNGYHLITSSFDLNEFNNWIEQKWLGEIKPVVHKDNPTILWMNTDWNDSTNSINRGVSG